MVIVKSQQAQKDDSLVILKKYRTAQAPKEQKMMTPS